MNRSIFKRKYRQLALVLMLALVGVGYWLSNRAQYPVLHSIDLPNGQRIHLHAVLQKGDSPFFMNPPTFFSGSSNSIIAPSSGMTIVMSCRDRGSHEWTSWDWLGTVEIKDQFGHVIRPNPDDWDLHQGKRSIWGNPSEGRGGRRSVLQGIGYQEALPYRNQYRLLSLHFATADQSELTTVSVIGDDGNRLGDFKTKITLPPPDPELVTSNIGFRVSNGDWQAQIEELNFRRDSGAYDEDFTKFSQVEEAVSLAMGFEFRGRFVASDKVLLGNQWLEDRMGNLFAMGYFRPALPTGLGVWRFVTHVARKNATQFDADELQPLGEFRFGDQVTFQKANNARGPTGLVLIPKGDRDVELEFPGFEFPLENSQPEVGNWAMGESLKLSYVQSTGRLSSYSGGPDGWTVEEGTGTRFSTNHFDEEDVSEVRLESKFTSSSPFRTMAIEAGLPLVIMSVSSEMDKSVHHLIATDESGKQLSVRPCYHVIKKQPVFAIDVEEDTNFSLFYCKEPLIRLDFIIPAPHTVIERGNAEPADLKAILVPDGNAWLNLMSEPSKAK